MIDSVILDAMNFERTNGELGDCQLWEDSNTIQTTTIEKGGIAVKKDSKIFTFGIYLIIPILCLEQ